MHIIIFRHTTRNFRGQGSNLRKRALCSFLEKIPPLNTALQIDKWRK